MIHLSLYGSNLNSKLVTLLGGVGGYNNKLYAAFIFYISPEIVTVSKINHLDKRGGQSDNQAAA